MSTIKASNIQNGSSSSVNIALNTDGSATFAQMPVGPSYFAMRNKIINGAMEIDQRNGGAAVTATSDVYTLDRWAAGYSAPVNAFTVQQSTTVPSGFKNSLLATMGTGASPSTTGYAYLRQAIEGLNIVDLGWGTANAKTITLSFWVRSSVTGTFGFVVRNSAADRAYGATYTISVANTFEYKTVSIPGDVSGTWLTTNGIGIMLLFDLGVGTTYSITAGSWQTSSNLFGVTGATKLAANTGATFYLTGVQLEVGSVATPFERRLYGQELALCQRYYFQYATAGTDFQEIVVRTTSTTGSITAIVPVSMRASPSLSVGTSPYGRVVFYDASFSVATANVTSIGISPSSSNSAIQIGLTHGSLSAASSAVSASFDTLPASSGIGLTAEL